MEGVKNPFYGKRHTPETRLKMSLAKKGKMPKYIPSYSGIQPSEETKDRIRMANLGRQFSLGHTKPIEERKQISQRMTGNTYVKGKKNALGHKDNEEQLMNKSEGSRKRWLLPGYKEKISKARKKTWANPEYRDKTLRKMQLALHRLPNKPESHLLNLLQSSFPDEWAYVGDGQLIVAGKNPDFANINGKKQLIELFGDYWHRGEDPQDRIDLFKKYGYNTLVIWERELSNTEIVLQRITRFTTALPTRNTARASQMLKGQRIDQGQGEDTAFERLGHQIPSQ